MIPCSEMQVYIFEPYFCIPGIWTSDEHPQCLYLWKCHKYFLFLWHRLVLEIPFNVMVMHFRRHGNK